MAKIEIEKLHPIYETHYDIAFPWLCCCLGWWRKRKERIELEQSRLLGIDTQPTIKKAVTFK
jgi:hypothetical protein